MSLIRGDVKTSLKMESKESINPVLLVWKEKLLSIQITEFLGTQLMHLGEVRQGGWAMQWNFTVLVRSVTFASCQQ